MAKDLLTERNDLAYECSRLRDTLRMVRSLAFVESVSPVVGGLPDKVMFLVDDVLGDNGSVQLRSLVTRAGKAEPPR